MTKTGTSYVLGQVMVRYKKGLQATGVEDVKAKHNLQTVRVLSNRTEVVEIRRGQSVSSAVATLKASGQFDLVQPNYIYKATSAPNDPHWALQWALSNAGQVIRDQTGLPDVDIDAPEAWPYLAGRPSVIVAVLDTGIYTSHEDLAGMIWTNPAEASNGLDDDGNGYVDDLNGWNFVSDSPVVYVSADEDYHGTHVAGTIAASTNNNTGIAGVLPNVLIMPLKVLGPEGGTTADLAEAIYYAADNGAAVINASLGMYRDGELLPSDLVLQEAIASTGILMVAAAGNDTVDNDGAVKHYPSSFDLPNVISVAAVDNRGLLATFSNYGLTSVDLGAPGVSIASTSPPLAMRGPEPAAVFNDTGSYQSLLLGFDLAQVETNGRGLLMNTALSAFGYDPSASFDLLLVNDAEGDSGLSTLYQTALAGTDFANAIVSTIEVVQDADGPDLPTLSNYDLVIWFTGTASGTAAITTVTAADQVSLANYLGGGGKLLLVGDDAIYRIEDTPFVTSVLGTVFQEELGNYGTLTGAAGTPFAGASFLIDDQFTGTSPFSDLIVPNEAVATAQAVLLYDSYPEHDAYIYLSGTSMAAPHVTGILAAAYSQKNLTPAEAINLVKSTGKPLASLDGKTVSGKMASLLGVLETAVKDVTINASNTHANEPAGYSVSFKTGTWGKLVKSELRQDTITLAFPAEFTVPAAIPADLVKVNGTPVGPAEQSLVAESNLVTIPVPATIGHNSSVTVSFSAAAGMLNPALPGMYTVYTYTSTDPVPVESDTVAIGISIALDDSIYRGIGAQDVPFDGDQSFVRRKAQATLEYASLDTDPGTAEQVNATVMSTTDPTGLTLVLTETGPSTGIFTGEFGFTDGLSDPGEGLISVLASGEIIKVEAQGLTATATWNEATRKMQDYLLYGDLTYDDAAIQPESMQLSLFKTDDASATPGVIETEGYPAGTGRYLALVPTSAAGDYTAGLYTSGNATLGETITLSVPGPTLVTYYIGGQWVDAYGAPQASLALAADADAPVAPAITSPTDGYVSAEAGVTVSGSAEPFAQVALQVDATPAGAVRARGDGSFTFALTGLADGNHALAVTAADLAGNTSPAVSLSLGVDTVPLTLAVDNIHAAMTSLTGTTKPGATVTVWGGSDVLGSATADGEGHYTVTLAAQPPGTDLAVMALDAAGREQTQTVTVYAEPTPSLASLTVSHGGLTFDPETTTYNLSVAYNVSSVTITATPANPWVSLHVAGYAGGSRTVNLSYGSNTFTVVAMLSVENKTTYTVLINRRSPPPAPSNPEPTPEPQPEPKPEPQPEPQPEPTPAPAEPEAPVEPAPQAAPPGTVIVTPPQVDQTNPGATLEVVLPEQAGPDTPPGGTVLVPGDLLGKMKESQHTLTISTAGASIHLNAGTLQSAAGSEPASLSVKVTVLTASSAQTQASPPVATALGKAPSQGLKPSGAVIMVEVDALGAEGEANPITRLEGTWTLTLPYDLTGNATLLGVYWLNRTTGQWEYVGGQVDPVKRVITVELDHFSEFAVFTYTKDFSDLPATYWAHGVIQEMAARHLIKGVTETTFAPTQNITRAEFATLLTRTLGLPSTAGEKPTFTDVAPADWFFAAVETAAKAGLIQGESGKFRPNNPITRQEMAVMMIRALGKEGEVIVASADEAEATLAGFGDHEQIGSWAQRSVAAAVRLGLITGRSMEEYAPTANATRAEAATVLHRLLKQLGKL